jgi:hypothetical protein
MNPDLSAPLTHEEFVSLRDCAKGLMHRTIPAEHKDRLIQLGYIQELSRDLKGPLWRLRHNTAEMAPRWTFHFIPTSALGSTPWKASSPSSQGATSSAASSASSSISRSLSTASLLRPTPPQSPSFGPQIQTRARSCQAREGSVRVNPLAKQKIGVKKIAKALKRTPGATGVKAAKLGVSLDRRG